MSVDEFIPTSGVFPRAGSILKKLIFAVGPAIVRLAPAPLTPVPAGWNLAVGQLWSSSQSSLARGYMGVGITD